MRVNENYVLRHIYGKYILMPIKRNEAGDEPISFNDMGAEIWQCAMSGMVQPQILQKIVNEYGLEAGSTEEQAVRFFINQLVEKKLLYLD